MRTKAERDAEVAKLYELRAKIPQFSAYKTLPPEDQDDHHAAIDAQIAVINSEGTQEPAHQPDNVAAAVDDAQHWLQNDNAPAPSEDWKTLIP